MLSCAGDYCSAPLHHAAALSAVLAVGVKMLQPSSKPCKLCTILQPLRDTRSVDGTLSFSVGFIRLSSSPLPFSHFLGLPLLQPVERSEPGPLSKIFKIKREQF